MRWLSFRPRVLLGIGAGIVLGIGAASLLRNYMLAAVLGALAAIAIGGLEEIKECTIVGLVTGAGIGLVWAARGGPFVAGTGLSDGPWGKVAQVVATMIVVGLACAAYSLITAKLKGLYDKSRGPFF